MEKLLSKIIIAILEGKDYRPHVLATINKRFIDNAHTLLEKVYTAKKTNKDIDWWITNLIEGSKNKNEVLMIEEAKKLGIKVIELRNKNALLEIYYFLKTHGVTASKPTEI
ncbi:MAG: CfrBI family restriction endonuclease, partial [Nitrospirota bacterium]